MVRGPARGSGIIPAHGRAGSGPERERETEAREWLGANAGLPRWSGRVLTPSPSLSVLSCPKRGRLPTVHAAQCRSPPPWERHRQGTDRHGPWRPGSHPRESRWCCFSGGGGELGEGHSAAGTEQRFVGVTLDLSSQTGGGKGEKESTSRLKEAA